MKRLILVLISLSFLQASVPKETKKPLDDKTNLIKEYQEMFEKISKKRIGLEEVSIAKVNSPFVKIVKKGKKGTDSATYAKQMESKFVLEAILNKRAMINGKWYKLYQSVNGLKIVAIKNDTVYLKDGSKNKKLTIRNSNANISIK